MTNHFKSACMDRIGAFSEAEGLSLYILTWSLFLSMGVVLLAALIASLPSNLLHRMIVSLVKENKRVGIAALKFDSRCSF